MELDLACVNVRYHWAVNTFLWFSLLSINFITWTDLAFLDLTCPGYRDTCPIMEPDHILIGHAVSFPRVLNCKIGMQT